MKKCYVLGFMFEIDLDKVALIRKLKPKWQYGLLNGIGGKIEKGETARGAMVREFREEATLGTSESDWKYIHLLKGTHAHPKDCPADWEVSVFACIMPDLRILRSAEQEQVSIEELQHVHPLRNDMIDNLPWLIAYSRWQLLSRRMEEENDCR